MGFIDNPLYKKENIWIRILIILVILLVISITFFFSITKEEFNFTFVLFLVSLPFFISLGIILLTNIRVLFVLIIENKYDILYEYFQQKPIQKSILKEIFMFLLQFLIMIAMVFFFLILPLSFHKAYMLPENLKNLDSISSSLNDNNYTSNKISYYNDKYIFIEHKTKDKNVTIEILKFDNLFKSK